MTLAVTRPLHDVLETQECSAWFANVGSVPYGCSTRLLALLPFASHLQAFSGIVYSITLTYADLCFKPSWAERQRRSTMRRHAVDALDAGAAWCSSSFFIFFWSGVFALWYFTHVLLQLSVLTCHCKPSWKTWYFADMFKEFTVHLAKLWFILVVPRCLFCCLLSWSPWHCRILSCLALHCSALPCVRIYSNHII